MHRLNVAVIGPRGIGRVHIREFQRAGASISGILGQDYDRTCDLASRLGREQGDEVRAFRSLEELVTADLDAVSICSPVECHLDQVIAALESGKKVFCEKPLFWLADASAEEVQEVCDYIRSLEKGRLALNTCNSSFLPGYSSLFGEPHGLATFRFEFWTNGRCEGAMIGVDLLPHAFALLQAICPDSCLTDVIVSIEKSRLLATCMYGRVHCEFDLRQTAEGERRLRFGFGNQIAERVQRTEQGDYQVFLQPVGDPTRRLRQRDPFEVFITDFVHKAGSGQEFLADAREAARNSELVAELLRERCR
jgi:predicted dehydrogenase